MNGSEELGHNLPCEQTKNIRTNFAPRNATRHLPFARQGTDWQLRCSLMLPLIPWSAFMALGSSLTHSDAIGADAVL